MDNLQKLQFRALGYQLMCFATLFLLSYFLVTRYTHLQGMWIGFTSFVVGTLLAPKFHASRTKDGAKIFMSWLLVKGIREVK